MYLISISIPGGSQLALKTHVRGRDCGSILYMDFSLLCLTYNLPTYFYKVRYDCNFVSTFHFLLFSNLYLNVITLQLIFISNGTSMTIIHGFSHFATVRYENL